MRGTDDDVAVEEKLIEQVKRFSTRLTELEDEVGKGRNTVVNLNIEMKAA